MKKVTQYDLMLLFQNATEEYINAPSSLDSKEQRAYAFLKAVTSYLNYDELDYSGLVRKNTESVFED